MIMINVLIGRRAFLDYDGITQGQHLIIWYYELASENFINHIEKQIY